MLIRPCTIPQEHKFSDSLTNYGNRFDICGPGFFALPEFLSKSQYKSPDNPVEGSFQLGHQTKSHFFEFVSQQPGRLEQFQHHMAGYRTGRPSWMDKGFFPVQVNLIEGAKTEDDSVFLVDLGGGKGHDLQELHQKHPNIPGKIGTSRAKGCHRRSRDRRSRFENRTNST